MSKTKHCLIFIAAMFFMVFSVIGCGLFISPTLSSQHKATAANVKDENVRYDSVEKIIIIDENKVCNITEIITVTYLSDNINIGLSRNVSKANKITRIVNGKEYVTKTINKLNLISLTMDDQPEYHFVEDDGDYYYINTGADYDYKVGQHVYKINYTYDMGEDFIDEFDDFTFDIMDYGFRSPVQDFSASITLPKEFLGEKDISEVLSFRTNQMKPISNEDVDLQYNPENLTITCSYKEGFEAKHGLTIQLILEEDYFDTYYTANVLYYLAFIIAILCIIAVPILIFLARHVKKGVVVPEFYPPEGLSPMDVAKCYRGEINKKDFAALIIHWASLGLIKIETKSKNHIILHKLKDYPFNIDDGLEGSKELEKDYFDALFEKNDKFDTRKERYRRNTSISYAVKDLYQQPPEKKKKTIWFRLAIHILSILPIVLFCAWGATLSLFSSIPLIFISIFPIIAILVFTYAPIPLWFKLIWCGGFGGIPFALLIGNFNYSYDIFKLTWIVTIIFLIGNYSAKFIRTFSKAEKEYRNKVLGFKKFLVSAEVKKLEMLVEENPEYYYNILPYCYVLGITKKMEKKFQALHMEEPEYLNGLTYATFCHCLSHSMGSAGGHSFSGGSSGGGGGGGSSGGGGGGGGCGGR